MFSTDKYNLARNLPESLCFCYGPFSFLFLLFTAREDVERVLQSYFRRTRHFNALERNDHNAHDLNPPQARIDRSRAR